jgi:hypothetical protein
MIQTEFPDVGAQANQPARVAGVEVGQLPPPKTAKLTWWEAREARLAAAVAFLKARCILVAVRERGAQIRSYRVSGRHESYLAEDVIALADRIGAKESRKAARRG